MSERTLANFVRHAELWRGVEGLYETARHELDDRNLARLAGRLRRIDPAWKLTRTERRRLASALLELNLDFKRICRQTGISRTTLWRLREQVVDSPDRPPKPALQSGAHVSKRTLATNGSRPAIVHLDATSGANWPGAVDWLRKPRRGPA